MIEETFGIINNAIFEIFNSGKSRETLNKQLPDKLAADFRGMLENDQFDKSALVENLYHAESKDKLFLEPKEYVTEQETLEEPTLDAMDIQEDADRMTKEAKRIAKEFGDRSFTETPTSNNCRLITILIIVFLSLAVAGLIVWFALRKSKEPEVVVTDGENGMTNVEQLGEKTVIGVTEPKNESPPEDSDKSDQKPTEEGKKSEILKHDRELLGTADEDNGYFEVEKSLLKASEMSKAVNQPGRLKSAKTIKSRRKHIDFGLENLPKFV